MSDQKWNRSDLNGFFFEKRRVEELPQTVALISGHGVGQRIVRAVIHVDPGVFQRKNRNPAHQQQGEKKPEPEFVEANHMLFMMR